MGAEGAAAVPKTTRPTNSKKVERVIAWAAICPKYLKVSRWPESLEGTATGCAQNLGTYALLAQEGGQRFPSTLGGRRAQPCLFGPSCLKCPLKFRTVFEEGAFAANSPCFRCCRSGSITAGAAVVAKPTRNITSTSPFPARPRRGLRLSAFSHAFLIAPPLCLPL